ncbi:MAG: dTMP kinase [Clostridia bacterium]|nr:dTMP kinase [Clostridia bacterium]
MSNKRGKFIVLEGLDGSGKTTQINKLERHLKNKGLEVIVTKEPQADRPIGQLLRRVLTQDEKTDLRVAASLFAADRLDHLTRRDGIIDALEKGAYVLCDRYYFSNYAYNMVDVDLDWIMSLNREAVKIGKPDLHIYVDVPADIALSRVTNRGETELFENLERLQRVHDNYDVLIDLLAASEQIFRVDGTRDSHIVFAKIRDFIDSEIIGN